MSVKTLNISMLKYFFETGADRTLFNGLEIAREKELCDRYMGQFPVIAVSLKSAEGDSFEAAKGMLCSVIGKEALRFECLAQSERLTETQRRQYRALIAFAQAFRAARNHSGRRVRCAAR